jgi:hypothetical protein
MTFSRWNLKEARSVERYMRTLILARRQMSAISSAHVWRSAAGLCGVMIGMAMISNSGLRLAGWLLGWFCLLLGR